MILTDMVPMTTMAMTIGSTCRTTWSDEYTQYLLHPNAESYDPMYD